MNSEAYSRKLNFNHSEDTMMKDFAGSQDDLHKKPVLPLNSSSLFCPATEIEYRNLSYTVKKKNLLSSCYGHAEKTILYPFSGKFMAGEFWALMGPSGSGKSSFLNILTARVPISKIDGSVMVNGFRLNSQLAKRFGYVMQDDVLHETLTVRETFLFTMMLKFGSASPTKQMRQKAQKIIDDLGLAHCADILIGGNTNRGLSGGERKRVSIGIELCKDQLSILLLDEPTSGLDSATAFQTLCILRKLCSEKGQTIICTIHQPHSNIYKLFDKVLLLSNGRCIYNGYADSALEYFTKLGYPADEHTNPADHMLDLVSVDYSTYEQSKKSTSRISQFYDYFLEENAIKSSNFDDFEQRSETFSLASFRYFAFFHWIEWLREWPRFYVLCYRNFKDMFRSKINLMIRFFQVIIMSVVLGLFYWQLGTNIDSLFDRQGILFFLICQQTATPIVLVINAFLTEKMIYKREHKQSMFWSTTFYASKVLTEAPFLILGPLIIISIVFPMVGLQFDLQHFFVAFLGLLGTSVAAQANGYLISTFSPSMEVANVIMPINLSVLLLFSGLFVNSSNIPFYFRWIEYINYIKYSYEIILYNEFHDLQLTCDEEIKKIVGKCPIEDGMQILDSMSLGDISIGYNLGYIIALSIGFHVIAYLGLKLTR